MSGKKSEQVMALSGCGYAFVFGYVIPLGVAWVLWTWPAWRPAGLLVWSVVSVLHVHLWSKWQTKKKSKPVPPEYRRAMPFIVGLWLVGWVAFLFLPLAFLLPRADALAAAVCVIVLQAGPGWVMRNLWPKKYY